MRISTEIGSASAIIGEERAIEYIAKAGFDAWDFSMDICSYDWINNKAIPLNHPVTGKNYLQFARQLKKIADDNGIICNQSHAPYPTHCSGIITYIKRAIECTAEVGGEICIIHPNNDGTPESNAEFYNNLLPFAKQCGVKIATENMWNMDYENECPIFAACATPESFRAHLDAVNDKDLVACLDIGHAELTNLNTSAVDMIKALGSNLQALHIHDVDKVHDSHQIPFSLDVNFTDILIALKDIEYNGYFTLEASSYLTAYNKENIMDGIKDLANSARKLADMFENL